MLRKASSEGKDLHLALLEYRNTPLAGTSYSPAQLLMSRRLKDTLPSTDALLQPEIAVKARTQLVSRQSQQCRYYIRGTRPSKPIQVGDHVRVKLGKTWDRAVITGEHPSPRSFTLTTEDGQKYRRNTSVIKPSPDKATVIPEVAPEVSPPPDPPDPEFPEPPAEMVEPKDNLRRSSRVRRIPSKFKNYQMY